MRRGELLIGGEWVQTREHDVVLSPYDRHVVGEVGRASADDTRRAIAIAAAAHRAGGAPPDHHRADILAAASALVREREESLATCIAEEAGKPLRAARAEVERGAETLMFASVEARRLAGHVIPTAAAPSGTDKLGFTTLHPKGVVAAVSPFNFPFNLVCHKLAPAFAAGCPVVLKPAGQTPFVALELAAILLEAGWPREFLSVLTGPAREIGDVFVESDDVRVLTFTGSTEVGYGLAAASPKKTVLLELGSNSPVIVDDTADLEFAAGRVAATAFANAGQSCISAQRLYVHESVAESFLGDLVARTEALVTGDPLDEATDVGPLIRPEERDRVLSWIRQAVDEGARVRTGGAVNDDGTLLPTIIDRATPAMKVCELEVFGPVLAVQTYDDFGEAIALSNASRYGLHAGVFTTSLSRALRAARELSFGGVNINESPTFRLDQQPYGGVRDSGNTREGPAFAIHDYLDERAILLQFPPDGSERAARERASR